MTKLTFIFLTFIFLISFSTRVYYAEDYIYDSSLIQHINYTDNMVKGQLYLGGVKPTTGNVNAPQETFGPFWYFFLVPIRYLSLNHIHIIVFISLLSSIAVILFYLFLLKFFDKSLALIASAFYAVSEWAIFYNSFATTLSGLPLFIILNFYLLFSYLFENKNWALLFLALIWGLILQIHLASIQIILISILSILIIKRFKFNIKEIKYILFAILIGLATLVPFIYNSHINQEGIVSSFVEVISYPTMQPKNSFFINLRESIGIPVMLSTNFFGNWLFGSYPFLNTSLLIWNYISTFLMILLFLIGLIFLLIEYIKKRNNKLLVLGIWILVPIIFMLFRNKNISPHYYLPLLPVQYLAIAFSCLLLLRCLKQNSTKYLFIILLFFLFISHMFFALYIYTRADQLGGSDGTYGIPYKYKLEAVDYIIKNKDYTTIYSINRFNEYIKLFKFRKFEGDFIFIENISQINHLNGYLFIDNTTLDASRKLTSEEKRIIEKNTKKRAMFGKLQVITI